MDFKIELRLGIGQLVPVFTDLPSLLFSVVLGGAADNDSAGLQRAGSAQNTIPEIVGCNHRQPDGFPSLFRHGERLRKQVLLDAPEKLVGVEFVFAGSGAPQQSHVEDNHVTATGLDAVQNISEVVEVEVVADGHQDISGARPNGLRTQLAFELQIELIHLDVSDASMAAAALRNGEHDVKDDGENAAGHGGYRFGEQVHDGNQKQRQRNQAETHGYLHSANLKVQRNLELALSGTRVAQYEYSKAVHGEAPNDPEGIEVREKSHIAAADENRENLQADDDIDNAVAGAKTGMRLAEPLIKHAILGNAVKHAVGADDGGVHGPGEDERAHDYHEAMKNKPDAKRALEAHGQAADQVLQISLPDVIGNNHYGKKRN